MRYYLASRIMPRTTLNLDGPVLADLKRLQRKEGKPLGDLASELLATAIAERKSSTATSVRLRWTSRPMGALVDLDDKEALFASLNEHVTKKNQRS
jgi:hypothetical protein